MEIIIIITLLSVIAISEITRLVLTHSNRGKKAHFKNKMEGTEKMVWDLEFKIFKTREIREDIRKEYDYMMQRIAAFDDQIKGFPKDGNKEELGRVEDEKVRAVRDSERFLAQMKQLDLEINGSKPTNELPDGFTGIMEQVDSLKELQGMLRDWIKKQ